MRPQGFKLAKICETCLLVALFVLFHHEPALAQTRPRLSAVVHSNQVFLTTSDHPATVLELLSSTNLVFWEPTGVFHDAVLLYPDLRTMASNRFYRASAWSRTPTNDWKNQIVYPEDPFRNPRTGPNDVEWVKFAILLPDPARVYYQDSAVFPFHYEFATQRLAQFKGFERRAFDLVSLHHTNRQVVLGAVLLAPDPGVVEYGVQFVSLDPFSPAEIARWFSLVKATIYSSNGAGAFYMPTFEQAEQARTNRAAFDALGVPVAGIERWLPGDHCYSPGWALGTLKFFPASEITAAYADGRLTPADILLTDGVPAETPLVAGIISLRPSTPNSHTAILSRAFGIPFVYFTETIDQERAQSLIGHKVILRAELTGNSTRLALFDAQDSLSPQTEAELLNLKLLEPIAYVPKARRGGYAQTTDTMTPSDIRYFGGKAANYGFLRRHTPTNSPPAIAFSFDLWDDFMNQTVAGGSRTLGQEIEALLAPFTNYPPNMPALQSALAEVREWITDRASFTASQQQAITNALAPFQAHRKIRFRSSTNVEDSESFTGAGLYDSYSGCLLDDLDDDTSGPSLCDPSEPRERGVFRAMQRVYASFYNQNAFLERLRHRVKESEVGMGVLVHHSFPDEDELANGVATLTWRFNPGSTQVSGELVTQEGAESVSNPDGTSIPEVVRYESFGSSKFFTLTRNSSLLPLGAKVMEWDKEYRRFAGLFDAIAEGFHGYYPEKTKVTLDFEYKKDRWLGLVVKQVRELPEDKASKPITWFLLNEPSELVVAQEEFGDVFSNHRLKSQFLLSTHSMWLVNSNLASGIYSTGRVDFLEHTNRLQISGSLSNWPGAWNSTDGKTNQWQTGAGTNARLWELLTSFESHGWPATIPVLSQADLSRTLGVTYSTPVPTFVPFWGATQTVQEVVQLQPRPGTNAAAIKVTRSFDQAGVQFQTTFWWPRPPRGIAAGYTAPLVRFDETRITGLTSNPIVLTNSYSQTYRPGHHNFTEDFIFEPELEPGLPTTVLAELKAKNVRLLYVQLGGLPSVTVLGYDNKFRPL